MNKIPVTLITGFLGAGKTTLLNNLLSQNNEDIAVIVNEFGSVSIDDKLLIRSDEEIMELTTGSICCAVKDDAVKTLMTLADHPRKFKRVFIETTGLASPLPLIQSFIDRPSLAGKYEVQNVITVVDGYHIIEQLASTNEAKAQIALADLVIINKVDLIDESIKEEIEDIVKRLNPLAETVFTENSKVDLGSIISPRDRSQIQTMETNGDHARHSHDSGVMSVSLRVLMPLDLNKFSTWIATNIILNHDKMLRYKGIVNIEGYDERFVFQGLHSHFKNEMDRAWRDDEPRQTDIVLIGEDLDGSALQESLEECVK